MPASAAFAVTRGYEQKQDVNLQHTALMQVNCGVAQRQVSRVDMLAEPENHRQGRIKLHLVA